MADPEFLALLRWLCDRHGIVMIADARLKRIAADRSSGGPARGLAAVLISTALDKSLLLVGAHKNVIRIPAPVNAPTAIVNEGLDMLESALDENVRDRACDNA